MISFTHVTCPVKVTKERDLYFAQPITFKSLKIAKDMAIKDVQVDLCTVQFKEDREIIPDYFTILDDLEHSILEKGYFTFKFPFIRDILDAAYKYSSSDYIIYSNSDIALMPYFYISLKKIIENGQHDVIIVNRRDIRDDKKSIDELPLMWAETGYKHPGWDCFIFKRDLYQNFNLADTVVGAVSIGRVLYDNLRFYSNNFIELTDSHLTFHLGISSSRTRRYINKEYIKTCLYNDNQLEMILNEMISSTRENRQNMGWALERLVGIKRRRKKYNEGLYGTKRYPGYWRLKKLLNLFGIKRDII